MNFTSVPSVFIESHLQKYLSQSKLNRECILNSYHSLGKRKVSIFIVDVGKRGVLNINGILEITIVVA
jgi:hypothetical protein